MKELKIQVKHDKNEFYIKVEGNDYYYDLPCTEQEAVIRSVMHFYGHDPDYCLDGIIFEEE